MTDSRGVTSYEYDTRDRLVKQTDPDGRSLSYNYEAAGNRVSLTIPSGTTGYTFDALNRLATVTDPDGGVTSYTYDAVGNRASVTYPNGAVAVYTYDSLNRLTNLLNRKSDGEVISSYAYTLAAAGNRIRVVEDTGRKVNYSYDKTYKLTNESINDPVSGSRMFNYTYDAVGNRLTKTDNGVVTTYTYDANNRLLTEGSTTYIYDNNGNTLAKSSAIENVIYGYDFQNHLVRANITNSASESSFVDYVYDANGIRVQKTENEANVTKYIVDKNQPFAQVLLETDGGNSNIVSYVYGDDLISQNRVGSLSYYHYDGQMSTRKLTNETGTTTDSYAYDAFGILMNSTGITENNYLYTGEQYDPNIGFYYLRSRMYNPSIGRFLTPDMNEGSIYDPVSLHKYTYSANNPINLVDPSGQMYLDIYVSLTIMSVLNSYYMMLFKDLYVTVGIADEVLRPAYALYYKSLELIAAGYDNPGVWQLLTTSREQIASGHTMLLKAYSQNLKEFAKDRLMPIKGKFKTADDLLHFDIINMVSNPSDPSSYITINILKDLQDIAKIGEEFINKIIEDPTKKGKIYGASTSFINLINAVLP